MKHINLSFAACGFLGIYHLGAASALCKHGKKLLKDVKAFAGASAGSLVASVLLTAPEKIEECSQFTYKFAEETRRQSFGAVTPGYDFMARLRSGMELILPSDAHELAQNRLHVSISNTKTRENYLVSNFSSREDLIKVLLASSFVPIYAGLKPVEYKGQKWVDGGLTNSLPILPVGRTVTISPFSGRLDISPQDKGCLDLYVNIAKQDIMPHCGHSDEVNIHILVNVKHFVGTQAMRNILPNHLTTKQTKPQLKKHPYHILLSKGPRNTTKTSHQNKDQNYLITGTSYQYPARQQVIMPKTLPPIPVSPPSL
ncbi:patatin-like phospholipase domain-containing protein 4 isoform X1 [Cebus imitator]|uniref:patatin-like phospholipase domain-containing protein 4 isoform X1 n=2 Tax=Cebus imitator TaxID=2715852 RepID=UPI0008099DF3|nr:patatin-like phospholipase domain-containing protein 4 isoform X1 [Cebus imitator]XP_017367340.1 patatin-like phospholipase domain-containing protein 4 isoform X1 [Cebus imitator]XP_017367341.1 patatin-like phospholipase domain-containing protein 4 isoform X1 [Cebus imitator]